MRSPLHSPRFACPHRGVAPTLLPLAEALMKSFSRQKQAARRLEVSCNVAQGDVPFCTFWKANIRVFPKRAPLEPLLV
jgi:hypothetical protein